MADNDKVLINLATGMEDGERVLVAFLVATAAQQQGKEVKIWTTQGRCASGRGPTRLSSATERLATDQFLERDVRPTG
jgi:hypothetical protein